jgi:uncharacterized protein (DUF3820 family)
MKARTFYQENSYIKWPYGKHKGKLLKEIPDDYLNWVIKRFTDQGMAQVAADELARRNPALKKL